MANITRYTTPTGWSEIFNNAAIASKATGTTTISGAIDNSATKDLYMDVSILLGGSITPTATGFIQLTILPLLHDGSTYMEGDATTAPTASAVLATIIPRNVAGSPAMGAYMLQIPPCSFKIGFGQSLGVTLAATGNSIQIRTYSFDNNT